MDVNISQFILEEFDVNCSLLDRLQETFLESSSIPFLGFDGPYCNATTDQIGTCWPRTSAGELVERPCPEFFNGIKYNTTSTKGTVNRVGMNKSLILWDLVKIDCVFTQLLVNLRSNSPFAISGKDTHFTVDKRQLEKLDFHFSDNWKSKPTQKIIYMRDSKTTESFFKPSLVPVVKDKIHYSSACLQCLELSFTC
ncbi:hypothetical protein BTVI_147500 [Pitangus sulphuratus]|nr:hypothetical protein BTVI_147500 [Pitangus sulphuratus]